MPIIVQSGAGHAVVVDRARTAAIIEHRPVTAQVNDQRTVQAVQDAAVAVTVGSPGVQGAPGPTGPAGGTVMDRIAAVAVGGHRIVRSVDAARVEYASHDQPTHGDDTLGLTLGAAAADGPVQVMRQGPITFSGWAWTPGPVFLGLAGLLTQTVPEAGFVQEVGYAETATTVLIDIQPPTYFD